MGINIAIVLGCEAIGAVPTCDGLYAWKMDGEPKVFATTTPKNIELLGNMLRHIGRPPQVVPAWMSNIDFTIMPEDWVPVPPEEVT